MNFRMAMIVVMVESLLPVVAPQKSHERETASSRREDDKNTRYGSSRHPVRRYFRHAHIH